MRAIGLGLFAEERCAGRDDDKGLQEYDSAWFWSFHGALKEQVAARAMGFYRSLTTSRRDCVDPCRHTRREGAAAAVAHAWRRSPEAERQPNRGCMDRRWSSLRDDAEAAATARNQMEGARHGRALARSQGGSKGARWLRRPWRRRCGPELRRELGISSAHGSFCRTKKTPGELEFEGKLGVGFQPLGCRAQGA
jgi:hypothetical protein